jgi:uncharacterized membrane-anchored protein YhcB (DUF1043 family)
MISFLSSLFTFIGAVGPLAHIASGPAVLLANFDGTIDWHVIVDGFTLLVMLFFATRPQPPLYKQFVSKEELEEHKKQADEHREELAKQFSNVWEVIKGLRSSVSAVKESTGEIKTDVATIKTMREANGERLKEVVDSLDTLVVEVATLNERTLNIQRLQTHGKS